MDNNTLFRTSFQGFKKEDVITYIERMSMETTRLIAEKDAQIRLLSSKSTDDEKFKGQIKEKNEKINALTAEIENHKEIISRLTAEIEEKDREISDKNQEFDRMANSQIIPGSKVNTSSEERRSEPLFSVDRNEYDALKAKYDFLVTKNDELTRDIENSKDLQKLQGNIGAIMLRAEKTAMEVTSSAESEAKRIILEANAIARDIFDKNFKACSEIVTSFEQSRTNISEVQAALEEKLETIRGSIEKFYSSVEDSDRIVHENMGTFLKIKFPSELNNKTDDRS